MRERGINLERKQRPLLQFSLILPHSAGWHTIHECVWAKQQKCEAESSRPTLSMELLHVSGTCRLPDWFLWLKIRVAEELIESNERLLPFCGLCSLNYGRRYQMLSQLRMDPKKIARDLFSAFLKIQIRHHRRFIESTDPYHQEWISYRFFCAKVALIDWDPFGWHSYAIGLCQRK